MKSVLNIHWKDWCWSWNSNTWDTWCEELTPLKRPWCWERSGQEEKGTAEDEIVGWHHWLNGHGFGWTLGVADGQGGLACCGSRGHKESDMTERLNWTEVIGGKITHWLVMRWSIFLYMPWIYPCISSVNCLLIAFIHLLLVYMSHWFVSSIFSGSSSIVLYIYYKYFSNLLQYFNLLKILLAITSFNY